MQDDNNADRADRLSEKIVAPDSEGEAGRITVCIAFDVRTKQVEVQIVKVKLPEAER